MRQYREPTPEAGCIGKAKHKTYEAALAQAKKGQHGSSRVRRTKIAAYRCGFCEHYHVGKQPNRRLKLRPYDKRSQRKVKPQMLK